VLLSQISITRVWPIGTGVPSRSRMVSRLTKGKLRWTYLAPTFLASRCAGVGRVMECGDKNETWAARMDGGIAWGHGEGG